MPENSFRPRMLNQYPDLNSFMEDAKQKLADAYATGSADRVEAVDKALAGRLRNYGLLSEYENERQAVLDRARQYGQERKEREQAAYEQANAERLANFKGMMAGPIANIREVGPAGYQPGFQGGMDFASLQGMVPPPPDNKYGQSLLDGINQGSQKAKEQQGFFSQAKEQASSLLGGLGDALSSPFAQRILAIMARPEFQDPRGISAGIVGAAAGLKKDEATARKAMQERQLEYDKMQADILKEQMKAGKKPEFKQFMAKMVTDARQQKQGLESIQTIKRLLGKEGAGGIKGAFENLISSVGAAFGASGGLTTAQQIEKYNAYLLSAVGSGIASGQISQEDYKRIDAMLKAPGITTDAAKLLDAYNEVERVIGGVYKANSDILRDIGYGNLIEPSVARDRGVQVPD